MLVRLDDLDRLYRLLSHSKVYLSISLLISRSVGIVGTYLLRDRQRRRGGIQRKFGRVRDLVARVLDGRLLVHLHVRRGLMACPLSKESPGAGSGLAWASPGWPGLAWLVLSLKKVPGLGLTWPGIARAGLAWAGLSSL